MTKSNHRNLLEEFIFNKMSDQGIVGLSIATIKDGKPEYRRAFGFRNFAKGISTTTKTLFCVGSVTKSFTAFAVMKLHEEGKLSIDDSVSEYLPLELTALGEPILIKHLLSHSGGLSALGYAEVTLTAVTEFSHNWLPISSPEDLMIFMNGSDDWALARPGEQFAYLNEGYILLGSIIERVSGLKYGDYIIERILKPLGMKHSTFYEEEVEKYDDVASPYISSPDGDKVETRYPYGQMIADGGLMSNVNDLVKYINILLDGGIINGKRILSERSINELITPKVQTKDIPLEKAGNRYYAYGHRVKSGFFGNNLVYHSGSVFGSSAYMGFIPDKKVGVTVMASGGYFLEDIGEFALAQLLRENPDDVPHIRRLKQLDKLTGKYASFRNTSEYQVTRSSGILNLQAGIMKRTWTIPLIPVDLEGEVKRFMIYGYETMTPVEFVQRDEEMLMIYQNRLAKRLNVRTPFETQTS